MSDLFKEEMMKVIGKIEEYKKNYMNSERFIYDEEAIDDILTILKSLSGQEGEEC